LCRHQKFNAYDIPKNIEIGATFAILGQIGGPHQSSPNQKEKPDSLKMASWSQILLDISFAGDL